MLLVIVGVVLGVVLLLLAKPIFLWLSGLPVSLPFAGGFDKEPAVFRRPVYILLGALVLTLVVGGGAVGLARFGSEGRTAETSVAESPSSSEEPPQRPAERQDSAEPQGSAVLDLPSLTVERARYETDRGAERPPNRMPSFIAATSEPLSTGRESASAEGLPTEGISPEGEGRITEELSGPIEPMDVSSLTVARAEYEIDRGIQPPPRNNMPAYIAREPVVPPPNNMPSYIARERRTPPRNNMPSYRAVERPEPPRNNMPAYIATEPVEPPPNNMPSYIPSVALTEGESGAALAERISGLTVARSHYSTDRAVRSYGGLPTRVAAAPEHEAPVSRDVPSVSGSARPEAEQQTGASAGAIADRLPQGAMSATLPGSLFTEHRHTSVEVVGPGDELPETQVDILFVHGHPDDESLDFGLLMSKAARSGKRAATVLFTDGESGYDRYPRRPVFGPYIDERLTGADLAEVRLEEAVRALSILGSEHYIRLGRRNHPYSSISEELTLEEVLERWGGLEQNVTRMLEIIRALEPELVVGPPGPTSAPEHFEHEAVGYILQEALRRLDQTEQHSVRGFLVAADPEHRPLYDEVVAIAAESPASGAAVEAAAGQGAEAGAAPNLRELQLAALRQYVSQYDASVAGVQSRSTRRRETYGQLAWRLEQSLAEWLSAPQTATR